MHKSSQNISILYYLPVFLILIGTSCSSTSRLAEGDYLLYKSKIDLDSKVISEKDLEPYKKQTPNKSIFGLKFHLFIYNLASPEKEGGFSGWLRKIGEEPVIWNPVLTERTTEQFSKYLEAKGFYESKVSDSIKIEKGKVYIKHYVELNTPHTIRAIKYEFEDQGLKNFIIRDTANCLIKVGNRFDKEVLQSERERIELLLKNQGFFTFAKEYIFYEANELPDKKQVILKIIFKENIAGRPDPITKVKHHHQYKINSTTIYPDYSLIANPSGAGSSVYDTVRIVKNKVVYSGKHKIKPDAVVIPNRCVPDSLFKLKDLKGSYNNYSSLGVFKVINIHFDKLGENDFSDTSKYKYLDCRIELTPREFQAYQTEFVFTHSAGDFGGRANFVYNNYNFMRGAENFQMKLTGAIEDVSHRISPDDEKLSLMKELGVETALSLPKFLVPFKATKFTQRFNPRTVLNISYNFQNRPDYIRTIANTSLSYRWKGNPFMTHQFFPLEFNYVELPWIKQELWDELSETPLITSFSNHTILASRYSFEFTNQVIEKKTDFVYLRTSIESAGNMINMVSTMASSENDTSFLNVPYFRYLKGDIDLRIHDQINAGNKWVFRLYAGAGYPLGKSDVLPFEKMYYAGGPSGVRAWETGELGPGSDTSTSVSYASKLGDIKLEANVEYRFKLFWKLEGAWFVDVGNVWNIKETRPGTGFVWNKFYKEIAVGTGIGGRFDFSFLIIRLDIGFKLRDPALPEGQRWIDFSEGQDYSFNDRYNFLFGIGYPF